MTAKLRLRKLLYASEEVTHFNTLIPVYNKNCLNSVAFLCCNFLFVHNSVHFTIPKQTK